jgi:hypothetical protein
VDNADLVSSWSHDHPDKEAVKLAQEKRDYDRQKAFIAQLRADRQARALSLQKLQAAKMDLNQI